MYSNEELENIKSFYIFGIRDREILEEYQEFALEHLEDFLDGFYERIFAFPHSIAFLNTDEIRNYHRAKISLWYFKLFEGEYDEEYFNFLAGVGTVHARINLPSYNINGAFHYIRAFFRELTYMHNLPRLMLTLDKILDMNLDVLTRVQKEGESEKLIEITSQLNHALENDKVVPFFQPIVSLKTGKNIRFEALSRIILDDGSIVSPARFIHVAEKTGAYPEITRAIFARCLDIFRDRNDEVSINLSTKDLADQKTRDFVKEKLADFPDPQRITLELLESEDLIFDDSSLNFISYIRTFGVKLAIDDFGSGYSNYENLTKIEIDTLKIDGSLIRDIDTNTAHRVAVESIVSLAKRLNIKTVAEFVSSEKIRDIVKTIGIDYAQGFFYSEPKEIKEF